MNQNQNNISIVSEKSNTNLKQQYNTLKQKIANLEKNNLEMIEIYKSEEERLIKSNEFLQNKNNHEHSRTIQDLESEVLKMRNAVQQLKNLIEQKKAPPENLIDNDNIKNKNQPHVSPIKNNSTEKQAKEEYLENYRNKLKKEFEKKLIMKHKELVDYYIEQNRAIKQTKDNEENYIDIDEIRFFSLNEKNQEKSENERNEKEKKNKNSLDEIIKKINENINRETKEIEVDKINKIISLLCLKEEYPKEFFIDYILDEAYSGDLNNLNQDDSFSRLLELEREAGQEPKNEIQKFIQKKPRRKSVFHLSMGISGVSVNKIAMKFGKLFDIKYEEDLDRIKKYLSKIKILDKNLRHYFEKNLTFRFTPYEQAEKEKYDKKIKQLFEKDISKIQSMLNFDENIIRMEIFEEFIKKYFDSNEISDDFLYYMMSLMKLSKKEKKEEKNKRIKSLGLFEFYLVPLYKKVNNQII